MGETKLVASISRKPAEARAEMNESFCSVETGDFSFWSPSLGPTSMIRTTRVIVTERKALAPQESSYEASRTHQI